MPLMTCSTFVVLQFDEKMGDLIKGLELRPSTNTHRSGEKA